MLAPEAANMQSCSIQCGQVSKLLVRRPGALHANRMAGGFSCTRTCNQQTIPNSKIPKPPGKPCSNSAANLRHFFLISNNRLEGAGSPRPDSGRHSARLSDPPCDTASHHHARHVAEELQVRVVIIAIVVEGAAESRVLGHCAEFRGEFKRRV